MSWDWEKLQEKRRRQTGGGGGPQGPKPPEFDFGQGFEKLKNFRFPAWKLIIPILIVGWALTGIYIVDPDEVGVVKRFGAYHRMTEAGPHYHWPYPIESAATPKVTQIRRVEVGMRSLNRNAQDRTTDYRAVPEESLMLTGDENIVDVQFIVQYMINNPVDYLFRVADQHQSVKNAAEAAMREVVGYNRIDAILTTDKSIIQNEARDLMQGILDRYQAGVRIVAVNLQDVHPPQEVVDAFKDVASAREDRSRIINEAEAYRNDILPKARGDAAVMVNQAEAYKESEIRKSKGEADRFLSVLTEYNKAEDVTRERLYLETMEKILSNKHLHKIILSEEAMDSAVPFLPLDNLRRGQRAVEGGQK
jgi:membrane protease subunit HflK